MTNHYETLRIEVTAKSEVIETAYKELIKKYHPDRAGENARVRQINTAYSVLRDPAKRKAYDTTLKLIPSRGVTVGPTDNPRRPESRPERSTKGNGRADSARNLVWLLIGLAALAVWALLFTPALARAEQLSLLHSGAAGGRYFLFFT